MRRKRTDAYGSATEGALDTYGGVGGRSRPVPTSGIKLGRQRQPANSPILRGEVRASNVTSGRRIGFNKVIQGTGKQRGITNKKNISGPNQTLGQVTESTKRPVNTVSFLMSRGMNYLTGLFVTGGISKGVTSALKNNNEEKKQKKRVGRTILSP